MDLKKVLVLCALLVVVFSAVSAVSAGLFDFLSFNGDKTYDLSLSDGTIQMFYDGDSKSMESTLRCDINILDLSSEERREIEELSSSDKIYLSVTLDDGRTIVCSDGNENNNVAVTQDMNVLTVMQMVTEETSDNSDEGYKNIKSGKLVLYGEDKTITINFD